MSEKRMGSMDYVFQSVNTPAVEKELIPLSTYLKEAENGEDLLPVMEAFCAEAGFSLEDFYHLPNHPFSPFCYYKEGVFVGLQMISKQYFDMFSFAKGILLKKEGVKNALSKGDYGRILYMTETVGQLMVFEYFYAHVPLKQKYELFMDMYMHQEYGFTFFREGIVEDALASQPEARRQEAIASLMKELEVTMDDRIPIYRGVGAESTPLEQALSWTTSKKIAQFFANRLGAGGEVITGEVAVADVIDYLTGRSESEVIVRPEKVKVLGGALQSIDTAKEMALLEAEGLIEQFQLMVRHYLPATAFQNPEGIHGILHTKRVLLHCLSLSNAIGVSPQDQGVLALAALHHDIGRKHDWTCTEHGKWSVEKMERLELELAYFHVEASGSTNLEFLMMEEEEILKFLMVYHCKPDREAKKALAEMPESETKERIERLFPLFKDADGLDRVRIGDLNPEYLRTSEAKKRIRFAHDVFAFLK